MALSYVRKPTRVRGAPGSASSCALIVSTAICSMPEATAVADTSSTNM